MKIYLNLIARETHHDPRHPTTCYNNNRKNNVDHHFLQHVNRCSLARGGCNRCHAIDIVRKDAVLRGLNRKRVVHKGQTDAN